METNRTRGTVGILRWAAWTAVAGVLVGGACSASVPMARPDEDVRAKAMTPAPGTALVYLYRHESLGMAVKMGVSLDGAFAGNTAAQTYMVWQVAPGRRMLMSKAENDSELAITAEAGRRYFVWQEVKMGAFSARSKLQLVPDTQAQKDMADCKLVQMPLPAPHVPPPAAAPTASPTPAPPVPAPATSTPASTS